MDIADQVTSAWLTERLRENGYLLQDEVVSLQITAHHKHHLRLKATYSGNSSAPLPADLILKWYEPGHPHGGREGLFYGDIVPQMATPPTPCHYDAVLGGQFGQTHILMADLSATHLNIKPEQKEYVTQATFEKVLDVYLGFHTHWWEHPRTSQADMLAPGGLGVSHEAKGTECIQANEAFFLQRALPGWIDAQGDQFPQAWHRVWERAIGAWARLFQERTAAEKALTLIHGDAHMDNVLVPRRGGRPCIIDWEGLARGLGIWDLSRLLLCFPFPSGMRYDLERTLVPRYHRRVEAAGIGGYSLEMCKSDYRLCILANIPHVLVWGDPAYMRATMEAWRDWECEALLL